MSGSRNIPIDAITDAPETNVRRVIADPAADAMLTETIRAQGVLQPILVRPTDSGGYALASGPAAEWIGAAVRADDALPRFDTPEFLAHVQVAELKRLAAEAGIKVSGSGAAVRQALAGKLPTWRPAVFGAPAPVVAAEEPGRVRGAHDDDDDGMEDAA